MRRTLLASCAVALAMLAAAPAARADQWSKTFSVTAKPHLALDADNAALRVTPGAAGQVAVRVSTTGWKIPDDVRVTETQSGNDIQVNVKQVRHWTGFSHGSVVVDVTVPSRADLDLSTGNGAVTLGAVSGTLHIGTGNGHIEANGPTGGLALRTGNGRIEVTGTSGTLDAHTGNGSVRVSGRFDALQIDSGRGSVEATVLPGSKMSSNWRIGTGVGQVTVSLPANFSAELTGSTGVGHISTDFPMTISGSFTGSSVRGRIGKGGPTLSLHTGVGGIHIARTGA